MAEPVRPATADDAAGTAAVLARSGDRPVGDRRDDTPACRPAIARSAIAGPGPGRDVRSDASASRHGSARPAAGRWTCRSTSPAAQGRGVTTALYGRLLEDLTASGFVRAHAGVVLPDPASVALYERLGFVRVGVYPQVGWKHGAWHDVLWLTRPLAQPAGEPPEPRDR